MENLYNKRSYFLLAFVAMMFTLFVFFFIASKQLFRPSTVVNFKSTQNLLIPGFPGFPVYPDAVIKESRKENKATENVKGYSAVWEVKGNKQVSGVMSWYQTELPKNGWTVKETPIEDNSPTEQSIKAYKDDSTAVLIIESGSGDNPNNIEILVDIPTEKL